MQDFENFTNMPNNKRFITYDFTKFRDRLKYVMDEHELDIPDMSRKLGYIRDEKIRRLLKKDKDRFPSYEILRDLAVTFNDLDMRWLITGKEK
jgi:hypothetical protein